MILRIIAGGRAAKGPGPSQPALSEVVGMGFAVWGSRWVVGLGVNGLDSEYFLEHTAWQVRVSLGRWNPSHQCSVVPGTEPTARVTVLAWRMP